MKKLLLSILFLFALINVKAQISLTITAVSSTICPGMTCHLNAYGATSYTWFPGGLIGNNIAITPTASASYTVYGSAGVSSGSTTANVTVVPNPTITVNSPTICSGQTATLIASGAISYTWSPSFNLSSTNGGIVYANPGSSTTYTLQGSSGAGCIGISTTNVTVLPTPTVSVNNATVCVGTSTILTANGASSYSWNTGASTNSISINPTTNTSYTVIGTNACGIAMATITVPVNQSCQDVWPGDANSDGIADNLDILELGLHFNQTGTPRTTTSNLWQAYYASNWSGTISNSKNLNHSDCNGDGVINNDDTLAIYNNYGLSHSFKTYQTSIVNPQLSIVPDQAMVAKGSWGSASVYLGDATTTVDNINGVAFTVNFDKTLIEPNSIYIDYQNSFMDLSNQNLDFRKLDFATGKIFTATTHTVNSNVSGYGKIATLHYQILSNLTTDQVLNFSLVQANQSDALGTITSLTTGSGTLMAIGASVGLTEILNNNLISIAPNPTNGLLNITSKTELQKIEIISIAGTLLLSESPTSNNHTLHLENCSNGIYFVNIYQNNRIVRREKVIVNK